MTGHALKTMAGNAFCMNCFARVSTDDTVCPACGQRVAELSERDYRDKLLHALEHPLADVRMRAVHALRLRAEAPTADPLAQCALKHPVDVVQGLLIIDALGAMKDSVEGRRALLLLSAEHPAHAVRAAACSVLGREGDSREAPGAPEPARAASPDGLELTIPGAPALRLQHLVLDFNGTLACDGLLMPGVRARMEQLSEHLKVHVLTADTFGTAREQLRGLSCALTLLPSQQQAEAKRAYVEQIAPASAVCVGNGRNDRLMLECAALSIAVIQEEAAAVETLLAADAVARSITDALDLLLHPQRLVATLRA